MAALGRQTVAFARIRTILLSNHTVSALRSLSATSEVAKKRRKKESVAEKAENVEIQKNYLQSVKSVVARFRAERLAEEERKAAAESEQQKLLQQERQLDKRIVEDLKLENELLSKKREERLHKNDVRKMKKEEQRLKDIALRREQVKKERTAMVLKAIEESAHFVTPENLEEKIEECLANENNYNFALTPDGDRTYSTTPPGNISSYAYGPGPAAYMFSPLSDEWKELSSDGVNKDTKVKDKSEVKENNKKRE